MPASAPRQTFLRLAAFLALAQTAQLTAPRFSSTSPPSQARHSSPRLPFDLIVSATLTGGTYKPEPKTYQGVCQALDLPTNKTAMVASHVWDLEAAAKQGVRPFPLSRLWTRKRRDGRARCRRWQGWWGARGLTGPSVLFLD